ncbi:MAG: glycosyltransferase [Burkholderiales bacterium]|nr:glycosyltransferase [Burkholderiales bacterium]
MATGTEPALDDFPEAGPTFSPHREMRAADFLAGARVNRRKCLIENPKVSVILPTFCRARSGLLAQAMESVLSQSFGSFELLVMDDGSTDGTEDLIADYVRADERVVHVRHDSNSGLPALRVNEGLAMARGEFCAYQFDDDRWTQGALDTLVGALEREPNYEVAYGICVFRQADAEYQLASPFNYSRLVESNYIANNSILHRRAVFERFGGYDAHVVMRRLCDWDLWLRWARHVRFLYVPEVVSLVDAAVADSLGRTVHYDSYAARVHMALPRDHLLRPASFPDYRIDGLGHLRHLGGEKTAAIWRQQIGPFRTRHRDRFPEILPPSRKLHVMVVKAHFDTTLDITILDNAAWLEPRFAFTFVPQSQAEESHVAACDILLLHRTIEPRAEELARCARRAGKAVVFLMDDDLLWFHELGEEFSYLAPGAPYRASLEVQIRHADLALGYSRLIVDSIAGLNPRWVQLQTSIPSFRLDEARRKAYVKSTATAPSKRVRIGFAGSSARREELERLWPAIVDVSRSLGSAAEFCFWGFRPAGLEQIESPWECEEFTFSYGEYLDRLTTSGFDIMLAPLMTERRAKQAKCPIKFLEITAAGAVGIYSDVEPNGVVTHGLDGIKCGPSPEEWRDAILAAVAAGVAGRVAMLRAALRKVEADFLSESRARQLGAALDAAAFRASLKRRLESRRARIAYFCHSPFLGGGENHLLRHAQLAQRYSFDTVLVLPLNSKGVDGEVPRIARAAGIEVEYLPFLVETEVQDQRQLDHGCIAELWRWLNARDISLVHSVTLMREVGEACRRAGVPHVSSLYATSSDAAVAWSHCDGIHSDSFRYANAWSKVLGSPAYRIPSPVPAAYFQIGERPRRDREVPVVGVFGTLQARKGQLQAIQAVGQLRQLHGIEVELRLVGYNHFFPDYVQACLDASRDAGIGERLRLTGFVSDPTAMFADVDVVLCASDWESLPQVVLEAMAARRLVVAPAVGGIGDVLSSRCGVLIGDNSADAILAGLVEALRMDDGERARRLALARTIVESEATEDVVAGALFRMYRDAAQRCPDPATQAEAGADGRSGRVLADTLERLRARLRSMAAEQA